MKKKALYRTDFLFANGSFVVGAGNVFNVAGNYYSYNTSESDEEADSIAVKADWGVVGQDIRCIIDSKVSTKPKKNSELQHI